MLQVEQLTVRYGPLTIVDKLSFALEEGSWLMVVGPNGAGKSTLVGAISQSIHYTGKISFQGRDLAAFKPREIAKSLGVLMQSHHVGYGFTVEEIVRLGRYAYGEGLMTGGKEDEKKVAEALSLTGLEDLRRQKVTTLSGGELQRTFLAQVLAQDPRLLILDEPTNHLDLPYQKQVFELIGRWVRQPGRGVLSVVHDLSLAGAYGTHALLMEKGRKVAAGTVEQVLTAQHLRQAYGMDVHRWMCSLLGQWEEPSGKHSAPQPFPTAEKGESKP
ncbi:MAG: ABC transporter ATP-binding protein [Oscillospiraceae bacterium]